MNVSFPLRDGYFPPLEYSPKDEAKWKRSVVELVQLGLHEERSYAAARYATVDDTQWKQFRGKDQLRVYRPRSASATSASRSPQCVLAIGTIDGTLEDVIQGAHHVTTQDMRTTTSFLSSDALDAAVLHVFENGTHDDPFRSFAVKWRVLASSRAGGLVKHRDYVALEYMGMDVDARGERFAFHVTTDFDHEVCPAFAPQCVIRARGHTRIIYRQLSANRVSVYFLGDYALSGSLPSVLARRSTAELAVSVGKSVECTEAKKLTSLALSSSAVLPHTPHPGKPLVCTVCYQSPGLLTTRTITLCHLCGTTVCSKCRSRKHLLSDEQKIPITCCKKCVIVAKSLPLDPRVPLRLVSAARWRNLHAIEGDDHAWERECQIVQQQSLSSLSRRGNIADGVLPMKMGASHVACRTTLDRPRSVCNRARSRPASDTYVASVRSNHGSLDLSYLDSVGDCTSKPNTKQPATKPVVDPMAVVGYQPSVVSSSPSMSPPASHSSNGLWQQMNELRVTAEHTYRLTKHTNQLYVGRY